MKMKSQGLCFLKCDLHVHTPASHDYKNKSATAEAIVESAINKGLSAIAVTDHNTGAFIHEMKKASKNTSLIVFPGIEISCVGGESGIHIIALFDPQKDEKTINALLTKMEIMPESYGKKEAFSTKSVHDAIDIIAELGGLPVLAHCTSNKGVLHELNGINRTKVFESPALLAVESSIDDYNNLTKKQKHTRAFDLLDGSDRSYNCRKLAVYSSSDAHSPDDIGKYFTYFKVDSSDISLESLRQSFIDRDVRILQKTEYNLPQNPHIKKISIKSGFFDNESTEFHSGLNTIIGAKGSGKSLLVELLRFGLNNLPIDQSIRSDHDSKLQQKLLRFGKVNIELIDELGEISSVERTLDFQNNGYRNDEETIRVRTFPVLFLSQNEIIRIAEDSEKQLKFIDSFFDFSKYLSRIDDIKAELEVLDRRFAQCLNASNSAESSDNTLGIYKTRLEKLEKQVSSPQYQIFKKMETYNNAIINLKVSYDRTIEDYENFVKKINISSEWEINEIYKELPELERINSALLTAKSEATQNVIVSINALKDCRDKLKPDFTAWENKFNLAKKEYTDFIVKNGAQQELEKERIKLSNEINSLTLKLNKEKETKNLINDVNTERNLKLNELDKVYKEFFEERLQKCSIFEKASGNKLKIILHSSTNNSLFNDTLSNMKKGSYLRDSDIFLICENFSARIFIAYLLRYYAVKEKDKEIYINKITEKCSINAEQVKKLFDFLLSENSLEELLKLQYDARSEDSPEINILVDSQYQNINSVSVGQKCNAMLIIALSDGDYPVIIDQPEDSLDIRSIWNDICSRIRNNKTNRQFIFTTHNSSLAVASDTDKYIIIESNNGVGKITNTGAIDSSKIKDEVVDYLEGGEKTYSNKYRKYGFKL